MLKPKTSPLGKLIGAILICLFWNGIVGLFTSFEITGFMNGEGWSWFLAVFLLIFQIIGLALIVNVPYPDARARESAADDHVEPGDGPGRRVAHDWLGTERGGAPGQIAAPDARGA